MPSIVQKFAEHLSFIPLEKSYTSLKWVPATFRERQVFDNGSVALFEHKDKIHGSVVESSAFFPSPWQAHAWQTRAYRLLAVLWNHGDGGVIARLLGRARGRTLVIVRRLHWTLDIRSLVVNNVSPGSGHSHAPTRIHRGSEPEIPNTSVLWHQCWTSGSKSVLQKKQTERRTSR